MKVWEDFIQRNPGSPLLDKIFWGSDFNNFKDPCFTKMDPITSAGNMLKVKNKTICEKLMFRNAAKFLKKYNLY